jgi:hypothetical protein
MISKILNIAKSNNSIPTWAIPFPVNGFKSTLVANIEQTISVPVGVNVAIFSYSPGATVQVKEGSNSETMPSGSFQPTNSRLNPTGCWVTPGSTLRFITSQAADYVYVSFYTNEEYKS